MTSLESLNEIDKRFRGFIGPVRRGADGFFGVKNTLDIVRASLKTLFATRLGERVMLPEYGSRIQEILFNPNDAVTRALAVEIVSEAVARWEPRIVISSVDVRTGGEAQEERLFIALSYTLKVTNTEDSVTLVFRRQQEATL